MDKEIEKEFREVYRMIKDLSEALLIINNVLKEIIKREE